MKKLALLFISGIMSSVLIAQELPQPSPLSKLEQKVGLTDISIVYSRPSVKGRTIFGGLEAYDKVWRLGANACTKFTCSSDIEFGGTSVKAGTYAMFAMPSENNGWTIILNTDTEQWGAGSYDEAKNIASISVKTIENSMTETLTIGVENIKNSGASISIEWEKVKVSVPFTVNTNANVTANIDAAIEKGENLDKVYYNAASYAFKSLADSKKAMDYLDQSFAIKKTYNALFLKAQILKKEGDTDMAIQTAEKALKLAEAAEKTGWVDYIQGNITDWKK